MQRIHINTAREMLAKGEPVDLTVWKQNGEVITYNNCVCTKAHFEQGNRTIKLLANNLIRTVRDVCIYKVNGIEVFL